MSNARGYIADWLNGLTGIERTEVAAAFADFFATTGVLPAGPAVISPSSTFASRWTPSFAVRLKGGIYSTNHDISVHKKTVDVQYYVDPINGSDAADGLTIANAKKTGASALVLTPSGSTIGVECVDKTNAAGGYAIVSDVVARQFWANAKATKHTVTTVRTSTNARVLSVASAATSAPTWVAHGTYANVYKTTITAANAATVVDLARKFQPFRLEYGGIGYAVNDSITLDNGGVVTVTGVDAGKITNWSLTTPPSTYNVVSNPAIASTSGTGSGARFLMVAAPPVRAALKSVASELLVSSTPGSCFHNGTEMVVRAHDSRSLIGDQLMQPCTNGNNGRANNLASNLTTYVDGLDFIGGSCFLHNADVAYTGNVLAFKNASFQGGNGNGFTIATKCDVYLYRCGAFSNWSDGFSYHSLAASPSVTGTSSNVFENECCAWLNGETGSTGVSDNASTAHEDTAVVRLNGTYISSSDRVIADGSDNAVSWNLGCYIGQAQTIASGKESVAAISSGKIVLDGCIVPEGTNNQVVVESGASLSYTRMSITTNTGPTAATPF